MRCHDCRKALYDFEDDALTPETAEAVRRHLAHCAPCARALSEAQETARAFRTSVEGLGRLSRFQYRAATPARLSPPRRLCPGFRPGLRRCVSVALSLAVVGLSVFFLVRTPVGSSGSPAAPAARADRLAQPALAGRPSPEPFFGTEIISIEDSLGAVNETRFITEEEGVTTLITVEMAEFQETTKTHF